MDSTTSDKVALIFGGNKGTGAAISNIYGENDYRCIHLSRGSGRDNDGLFLDIDSTQSIQMIGKSLSKMLCSIKPKNISVHFLCGGGMGLNTRSSLDEMARVSMHNYIFPYTQVRFLQTISSSLSKELEVHCNFYLSAVAISYLGDPIYVASKCALEGLIKALVRERHAGFYYSGFRLGMVDVEYKYFRKLSVEDPSSFNELLSKQVPSLHFTTTDEVARTVFAFSKNMKLANGMICDISGGNSW